MRDGPGPWQKTASGCGTVPVLAKSGLGLRDDTSPGKKRPRAAGRHRPWAKSGLRLRCKRWMTFQKFEKPQVKRVWPFVSYGIHRSPRRKNATRLPHGRIPGFGTWRRMMCDKTAGFGISCRKIADKIRGFGTQARQDCRFGTHLLAKQLVWYLE